MAALPPVSGGRSSPAPSGPGDEELRAVVGSTTSSDIERDYGTRKTQRRWQEASYQIIRDIAVRPRIENWQELFEALAAHRHELAKELNQWVKGSSVEPDGNDFGILRSSSAYGRDAIHRENVGPRGPWRESYPKCRDLLLDYLKRNFTDQPPPAQIICIKVEELAAFIWAIEEGAFDEDEENIESSGIFSQEQMNCVRDIFKLFKGDKLSDAFARTISFFDNLKQMPDFILNALIAYPSGYFVQAVMERDTRPMSHQNCGEMVDPIAYRDAIDKAYVALLQPEADQETFRYKAAKFYYLMLRLLPCHRGMASIIDWMMRGIALKKGYRLGPYNHQELGWDMKALLTPSEKLEEYCQWFRNRAFVH